MTDNADLEQRINALEQGRRVLNRHGMRLPAETPLPITVPPMSEATKAKVEADRRRRAEEDIARAAEAERRQREAEERARPRTLVELRTELAEIDEELRSIASRPAPSTRSTRLSGSSWQAKNDARIAVAAAAARVDQLRLRRGQVIETIEVIVEWQSNERARRRAIGDLPKARKVVDDIEAELLVVEGECTQARSEVQRLEALLIRPDVVPEES